MKSAGRVSELRLRVSRSSEHSITKRTAQAAKTAMAQASPSVWTATKTVAAAIRRHISLFSVSILLGFAVARQYEPRLACRQRDARFIEPRYSFFGRESIKTAIQACHLITGRLRRTESTDSSARNNGLNAAELRKGMAARSARWKKR